MKISVCVLLVLLSLAGPVCASSQRIAGIAIAKNDDVYAWFKDGKVTTGSSRNFEKHSHARPFKVPDGETVDDIVAISIAASDDKVYVWYRDGKRSVGTATDLAKHSAPQSFTLPPGVTTASIVGIGIAQNDQVYAWYDNLKYSIGSSTKLDKHHAPQDYSLPPGKIASQIVEIDIAKSNNRVYAWYKDGFGSTGVAKHLDEHLASFPYVPSQVLYQWWGPEPQRHSGQLSAPFAGPVPAAAPVDDFEEVSRWLNYGEAKRRGGTHPNPPPPPPPDPGGDPSEPEGNPLSPAFTSSFLPNFGSPDLMIAVGKQNLIVSNTGWIAFFDKSGNALPETTGFKTRLRTSEFFQGFVAKSNAGGAINENNINLYMGLPKPCDSPEYPQLESGNRFCVGTFYDTRVSYDSTSGRFFIISNSRHALWNKDCVEDGKKCSCYTLADPPDQSVCTVVKGGKCNVSNDKYCGLARRFIVFAVSKSEDPRDGFHQYISTENNPRDWPWQGVNGGHYVAAHNGKGDAEFPVATVFSVDAIKTGVEHPPYFRYYSKDVGDATRVLPVTQYESKAGRTYLLGSAKSERLDIFAFPQSVDPWTKPTLQPTSVHLGSPMPHFFGAVYRRNRLYLVGSTEVDSKGEGDGKVTRYSVHLFRIPVEPISGTAIQASKDPAKGFLDSTFGKRSIADQSGDRFSYEFPAVAVNKAGDMLFGYGRRPFESATPLKPEARYSMWYSGEPKIRSSWLLEAGKEKDPGGGLDYVTAVVDPDEKTFWVALPFVDSDKKFKMAVGKITP